MDAPTLALGGLVLREPVTVVTDLLLAAECAASWAALRGMREAAVRAWAGFFLFMGLATLLGAVKHAAPADGSGAVVLLATLGSDLSGGASATFAGFATLRAHAAPGRWRAALHGALGVELLVFTGGVLALGTFAVVVAHAAGLLLTVMAAEVLAVRRRRQGSGLILAGPALNVPSAAIYVLDVSVNAWVDRNGLAHGFMMVGLPLIHLGLVRAGRAGGVVPAPKSPSTAEVRGEVLRTPEGATPHAPGADPCPTT